MTICGPTLKVPEAPMRIAGPAPMLGEHTREVLAELLGYSDERLDRLQEQGII
jgi:crotonobetainyl-CoA:carnitine CoA-transferase CaiB-like acyl-CoA transferase